ncbi:hypothetical protein BTVI_56515 [Pitangus sulphuratus]|nr:hypothetical protein BTVI_56515 [Pitangus sulphuratus]
MEQPVQTEMWKARSLEELVRILHQIFAEDKVSVEEVQALMESYESNPEEWLKYAKFDQYRYTRNLVDSGNGKFNLMILCWGEGHGRYVSMDSSCGITFPDEAQGRCRGYVKNIVYLKLVFFWLSKVRCLFPSSDPNLKSQGLPLVLPAVVLPACQYFCINAEDITSSGHITLLTQRYAFAMQPRDDTVDTVCFTSRRLRQVLLEIPPSQAPHKNQWFSCLDGAQVKIAVQKDNFDRLFSSRNRTGTDMGKKEIIFPGKKRLGEFG